MPKQYLFLPCFLGLFCGRALAQQPTEKSVPLFFEKVYLHTDRDAYAQGENIWFKAYLINAQDNTPIDYSHLLYVELISPSAKIIARNFLRMDKGLGNGDFKLSDTVAAGTYRIRAYTNWMRNFGDNFIFEKTIRVADAGGGAQDGKVAAVAGKSNKKKNIAAFTATQDTLPVVWFFPEGGSMINGVNSLIAVKAEDANGRGIPASGTVINNQNQTVVKFNCDSLGFGSFSLVPDAAQHYQALVNIKGATHRFMLPEINETGYHLSVQTDQQVVTANISCNQLTYSKNKDRRLFLMAKHGGKTYFRTVVLLTANNIPLIIPYDKLPEGITSITIADEQNEPLCERLIYISHPDETQLILTTDKKEYQPREKMTVNIKLNKNEAANLSLAAVDAAAVPVPTENILSYLNLQSEVKGKIEHANRYFDPTNTSHVKQMDLLLLTQGWRDFVWKRLEDTTLKLTYELEQGINITGRVRRIGADKPLQGINITMHAPKASEEKLFWVATDSAGKFSFFDPQIYGRQFISFTARSGKINKKGKSGRTSSGWIEVDSLFQDTLRINPLRFLKDTSHSGLDELSIIEKLRNNLHLDARNNLKEVKIKANISRLVTHLPTEIRNITIAEQKEYDNIGEYLMYHIEGAQMSYGGCRYCAGPGPQSAFLQQMGFPPKGIPIKGFYADGSKIDYCYICQDQYLDLPMNNVLKITINRSEDVYGKNISVILLLRPGVLDTENYFDNTVADMTGYYKARVFYKPKFEEADEIADRRTNTIHWEPNIVTNDKGEATVAFFNKNQKGNIRLIVQGVSNNGTPLVAGIGYSVK